LIEIIKDNQIEEAIRFAQTQIAPKCSINVTKENGSLEKL